MLLPGAALQSLRKTLLLPGEYRLAGTSKSQQRRCHSNETTGSLVRASRRRHARRLASEVRPRKT
jgi:hypothetical protein